MNQLVNKYTENHVAYFDIKFTRFGFENACYIFRLAQRFNKRSLKALPGQLDIKRHSPCSYDVNIIENVIFSVAPLCRDSRIDVSTVFSAGISIALLLA